MYIVQLENDVWLADWDGDPGQMNYKIGNFECGFYGEGEQPEKRFQHLNKIVLKLIEKNYIFTGRGVKMKKVTEETLIKRQIKEYLKYTGWFCFSQFQGLGAHKGISDIVAIKDFGYDQPVVLFIEVKSKRGRQSDYQVDFQNDVEEKNGNYLIARCVEDVESFVYDLTGERNLIFA